MPFPCPGSLLVPSLGELTKTHTISDKSAHVRDARPFSKRGGFSGAKIGSITWLSVLRRGSRLSRETTFVYFKMDRGDEADVRWNTISNRKCNQIARYKFVREDVLRSAIPSEVTIMRDKFIQGLQRFFRALLLHKTNY